MSILDGTWDVTLHAPQGDQTGSIEFADGSGTMLTADSTSDVLDLTVDGDKASWRAQITQPMALMVEFSATADGDNLNGTATAMSVIKIPFDGTRR